MRPVAIASLIGICLAVGVLAAILTGVTIVLGGSPLAVTPLLAVLLLVLAALLWWAGSHVRRYRAKKPTWVDGPTAMRIAVIARASAYVGAGVAGALLGSAGAGLMRVGADAVLLTIVASTLTAIASVVWSALGVLVERWCLVDPRDDDGPESTDAAASPA
ncbi:DUF3180 domain-containing protein [Actinomyces sp. B33]|uniref:DUF3180 domain-containing protein n=1 Tax=Actinomyces sp. B33 TaxID=2942131 RepID=UPI00233FD79D|nr:DUF3180 domain-containing protein [Actinomyces sp. B33]MDC4233521.1 DUF3180 domain-containing protein [Actinomyces sp. B33]